MELIYIVVGGSIGVILMALGVDVARDTVQEFVDGQKSKKVRGKIEDQALRTLEVAGRLKNAVVENHRPHGTHRRIAA